MLLKAAAIALIAWVAATQADAQGVCPHPEAEGAMTGAENGYLRCVANAATRFERSGERPADIAITADMECTAPRQVAFDASRSCGALFAEYAQQHLPEAATKLATATVVRIRADRRAALSTKRR
jgi:hypothetical protein